VGGGVVGVGGGGGGGCGEIGREVGWDKKKRLSSGGEVIAGGWG